MNRKELPKTFMITPRFSEEKISVVRVIVSSTLAIDHIVMLFCLALLTRCFQDWSYHVTRCNIVLFCS